MSEHRRFRRCAVLMIEPRERLALDIASLFAGESALKSEMTSLALAPHLGEEIALDDEELLALMRVGETPWIAREELERTMPANVAARLLDKGLLIGDGDAHAALRERDEALRADHWRALSAVAHAFSRWTDDGTGEDARVTRHRTIEELVAEHGLPPPHLTERTSSDERIRLPAAEPSALDDLFRRRATCRNFDTSVALTRAEFASVIGRVLGCLAIVEVMPGVHGLKKANPSGGGLHPLEPYLFVRRVEGLAAGLYHYHAGDHALEPLTMLSEDEARKLAKIFVAGQEFFADAPVHVVLVARFGRTFWKYRNHAKAYRAIVLEAGHVSQNLYLAATEAGLGAYVTAAINEVDIERAFGLDPLRESPIAVCGFGPRAKVKAMMEFDPLGTVWK